MALAHWFNITFNDNTSTKKLFFKLKFLHVDNTFLKEKYFNFDDSKKEILLEERNQKKHFLDELFKKYNFEYEIVNLENVLELEALNVVDFHNEIFKNEKKQMIKETNFPLITKYLDLYENISKAGSFETDFNKILTKNIILFYSRLNGFNKLIGVQSYKIFEELVHAYEKVTKEVGKSENLTMFYKHQPIRNAGDQFRRKLEKFVETYNRQVG